MCVLCIGTVFKRKQLENVSVYVCLVWIRYREEREAFVCLRRSAYRSLTAVRQWWWWCSPYQDYAHYSNTKRPNTVYNVHWCSFRCVPLSLSHIRTLSCCEHNRANGFRFCQGSVSWSLAHIDQNLAQRATYALLSPLCVRISSFSSCSSTSRRDDSAILSYLMLTILSEN